MKTHLSVILFLGLIVVALSSCNNDKPIPTQIKATGEVQKNITQLKPGDILEINRIGFNQYLLITESEWIGEKPGLYRIIGMREKTARPTPRMEDMYFYPHQPLRTIRGFSYRFVFQDGLDYKNIKEQNFN